MQDQERVRITQQGREALAEEQHDYDAEPFDDSGYCRHGAEFGCCVECEVLRVERLFGGLSSRLAETKPVDHQAHDLSEVADFQRDAYQGGRMNTDWE